jgi:16S rRNA (cytosine967-C5)-methyltransferase
LPKVRSARQLALEVCQAVVIKRRSLNRELDRNLPQLPNPRDRALASEMCYGLCRYYHLLGLILRPFLKKPLKKADGDVRLVLLLGIYQLRFMRVEDHAAVNESVKLVAGAGKPWARGLVNGVLRNYQRQLHQQDPIQRATLGADEQALTYPEWLLQRIREDWPEQAAGILTAGNSAPPLVLRVDLQQQSREQYLQRLQAQGIAACPHPRVDSAVTLNEARPVGELPGFDDGQVSVQDASAQLAAVLLDLQPGHKVLDACAAPGGKTLHMLQSCQQLDLVALDRDRTRLERVGQNLQRGGVSARLVAADAAQTSAWVADERFDRILLDAPCSASGIIRRHPDIRILRLPSDIDTLVAEQARLLDAMWSILKPGGLLLYATCSIMRVENERQVSAFLERRGDCVERPLNPVQWGQGRPVGRQIFPAVDDMDGFYYALLEKTA